MLHQIISEFIKPPRMSSASSMVNDEKWFDVFFWNPATNSQSNIRPQGWKKLGWLLQSWHEYDITGIAIAAACTHVGDTFTDTSTCGITITIIIIHTDRNEFNVFPARRTRPITWYSNRRQRLELRTLQLRVVYLYFSCRRGIAFLFADSGSDSQKIELCIDSVVVLKSSPLDNILLSVRYIRLPDVCPYHYY